MQTPTLGQIVHVALPKTHTTFNRETAAAIVTGMDQGHLTLTAFPAGRLPYIMAAPLNEGAADKPGTWFWPPKV